MISLENATVCLRCFLFQLSQGFAQPSIVTMLESVLLSVLQIATAKETASVVVTAADAFADGQCIKVLCRLLSLCFSFVCLYPVRKFPEKSSDIIFVDKTWSRFSVGYEWSLTPEEKKIDIDSRGNTNVLRDSKTRDATEAPKFSRRVFLASNCAQLPSFEMVQHLKENPEPKTFSP